MTEVGGSHWSYDMLKALMQDEVTSYAHMEELKEIFATEIESPRRLECIRSVKDLIDCLERRDIVNEYNIDGLRDIADNIDNPKLQSSIAAYVTPKEVTATEPRNQYQECRLADELRHSMNISRNNSSQMGNCVSRVATSTIPPLHSIPVQECGPTDTQAFCEKKRSAVYKLLSRNIGTYWRSLGRELNLTEGDMDAVEVKFPNDLSSRIYNLMQLFEEESEFLSEAQKILSICRALDGCGRKDLRRKVENIIASP